MLLLSALLLWGCATTSGQDVVLERSFEGKPAWVENPKSADTDDQIAVVYSKEEIYRLELGLKQVQVAGISETQDLLFVRAKNEVELLLEQNMKKDPERTLAEISKAAKEARRVSSPSADAVPHQVYWERVRRTVGGQSNTFYIVYAELRIPRLEFDRIVNNILLQLTHSTYPALAKEAQENLRGAP